MTKEFPADRPADRPAATAADTEAAPLRNSLLAHFDRNKMIHPLGSKTAVTPKIGEGWGSS